MFLYQLLWITFCTLQTGAASERALSWQHLADALLVQDVRERDRIRQAYQRHPRSTLSGRARLACSLAEISLSSTEFIEPASSEYANFTRVNWSDDCWQDAACFVTPLDADEVSTLFIIVNAVQSRFSIRSGGHDFNRDHSSVDGAGLLIDTRHLNQITLASNKETAVVGTGARWGEVYKALNGSGVSINGARSPNPAVGGQTLGAGIGWLSSVAGVTAASVVAVDMVLPNGSQIHADEATDPDFLRAIRGGGPNFGLITAFTFRTLPIDKIWYEARLYTADKNIQLVGALIEYQKLANEDSDASMIYSLSESTTVPGSLVGFAYLKPVERPAVFAPFFDIPFAASFVNSTFGTLADLADNFNDPQYPDVPPERQYVVSLPQRADNATYYGGYNAFKQFAIEASTVGGVSTYGSQPMAITALDASADTPLGLTREVQDWIHVTMTWSNSSADAQLRRITHQIGDAIEAVAVQNGASVLYRFMNDANAEQNVLGSYGASNLEYLRRVAQRFDPEGVMQRLQNGGWLLDRAF